MARGITWHPSQCGIRHHVDVLRNNVVASMGSPSPPNDGAIFRQGGHGRAQVAGRSRGRAGHAPVTARPRRAGDTARPRRAGGAAPRRPGHRSSFGLAIVSDCIFTELTLSLAWNRPSHHVDLVTLFAGSLGLVTAGQGWSRRVTAGHNSLILSQGPIPPSSLLPNAVYQPRVNKGQYAVLSAQGE